MTILLILVGIFGHSRADVGPKNGDTWVPTLSGPVAVDKDPLTVADIVIDKTAANSVAARDAAIADAPAIAFQKLAERNLPEKQAKAIKVPKNVSSLVQDFEIKGEQMSSTRYVAKFTVRFSDAVREYINVNETPVTAAPGSTPPGQQGMPPSDTAQDNSTPPGDEDVVGEEPAQPGDASNGKVVWNDSGNTVYTPPSEGAEPLGKVVLILPYLENMAGHTVLWEDPNPWRRIWQNALPSATLGGSQLVVPLGDVSDLAAGPSNAAWSGDYGTLEKLRRNYNADEVLLLAANKSGSSMTVDVYTFREGRFRHRGSITPFVGDKSDVEAYRQALADTLRYLMQGQQQAKRSGSRPSLESISRDVTHSVEQHTTVVDSNTPPSAQRPQPNGLILKPYNTQPVQPVTAQPMPPSQTSVYTPPGAAYVPPGATQYAPVATTGRAQLAAMATFRNFQAWVELQRRLSSMAPMVGVDIRSINSNSAAVTLNYASSIDALKGELASRGIVLGAPSGMDPVQGPVYSLQLVN